jgi:glycosyltransferase involved in cell wall biosynthesis
MIKASVCIATFDKVWLLEKVLPSIFTQQTPFKYEVLVVDDGSPTIATRRLCREWTIGTHAYLRHGCPLRYFRIDRTPGFRNPAVARNVAYRAAKGSVIIAQSDDVVHTSPKNVELLVTDLEPGHTLMAHVVCQAPEGLQIYMSPKRVMPFFFLGSLRRQDLYAVGGNDEDFAEGPCWDDLWFADCLVRGLRLQTTYSTSITGHHLYHTSRFKHEDEAHNEAIYRKKYAEARAGRMPWEAHGGPWPLGGPTRQEPYECDP